MKDRPDKQSQKPKAEETHATGGSPGEGQGRKEEAGESGVYPASGPLPLGHADTRRQAAWGRGSAARPGMKIMGPPTFGPCLLRQRNSLSKGLTHRSRLNEPVE